MVYETENVEILEASNYDSSKPTVYLVEYSCGQYDTYSHGIYEVYEDEKDAVRFVRLHEQWRKEVYEKALTNYQWDGFIGPDGECHNTEENPYDELETAFNQYKWNKLFPDKDMDDMTDEDEQLYFDSFDDTDEEMTQWLITERELPIDVAEATVTYNNADEWSPFRTDYTIRKINIIKKGETSDEQDL